MEQRNHRNDCSPLLLSRQEDIAMRKFLTTAASLALSLSAPAALANNDKKSHKSPPQPSSNEAQNVETKDRKTLTAKSGLLNTETTPEQARKTAEATNRQVLQQRHRTLDGAGQRHQSPDA
jgi:hypothetical protein